MLNFRRALYRLEERSGLEEAFVLVSPEADRVLTMTVWDGRDVMERSGVSASRLRSEAAKASGGNVLSVQESEVAVRDHGAHGDGMTN